LNPSSASSKPVPVAGTNWKTSGDQEQTDVHRDKYHNQDFVGFLWSSDSVDFAIQILGFPVEFLKRNSETHTKCDDFGSFCLPGSAEKVLFPGALALPLAPAGVGGYIVVCLSLGITYNKLFRM
jgi:hypothetical protein